MLTETSIKNATPNQSLISEALEDELRAKAFDITPENAEKTIYKRWDLLKSIYPVCAIEHERYLGPVRRGLNSTCSPRLFLRYSLQSTRPN